jgi:hypothetical protein
MGGVKKEMIKGALKGWESRREGMRRLTAKALRMLKDILYKLYELMIVIDYCF